MQPGDPVLFSPVQVGKTARLTLSVRNEGTSAATVATIGLSDTRGIFNLEGLPALPLVLQPAESSNFTVIFSPTLTGPLATTLLVHSQSFSLSGFGTPPVPLPAYRFSGVSGATQPLGQPAIQLTLDEPYALAIRGTLTLLAESDALPPDPSVQFITGGRQIAFTIPPNSSRALFASGSESARFQTGTVAGTISFTPAFATTAGLDLTPVDTAPYRVSIPPSAPTLLSVQVASQSADSVVLLITGFATSRTLSKVDFTFTGASGVNLSGAQVSVNLESAAANWFRTPASQPFGGQFSISLPFTFRSDQATLTSLLDKIRSVSVTASNGLGSSNAVTTTIR